MLLEVMRGTGVAPAGEGLLTASLKASFAPFPHARGGHPTWMDVSRMHTVFEDVPVESMMYLLVGKPKPARK